MESNKRVLMKEELTERLKKLEEEREELEKRILVVERIENEEDANGYRNYMALEHMRDNCRTEDVEILQMLDEQQDMLNQNRKQRQEFADMFREENKKTMLAMEMQEEDIREQIQLLKKEAKKEQDLKE